MKITKFLALLYCLTSVAQNLIGAQSFFLPPRWTASEQVSTLLRSELPSRYQVSSCMLFHADNNVLPLKLGDEKQLPPLRFNGDRAYFVAYRFKELSVTYRRWALRYGHGKADFYEGNGGAAQLYLDAMANVISTTDTYDVVASLNRTRLHRWSLEYVTPLRIGNQKSQLVMTLHWLRLHRLQHGTLTGRMNLGQFRGDLRLLTTRGLPNDEVRSNGLILDVSLLVPIGSDWRLGIWSGNLFSRLWQRTLQDIKAQVATNVVEPDADGFLHAVPFLQGRVDRRSLTTMAKRRWTLALSGSQGQNDWLLLAQRDVNGTQVSLGYAWEIGEGRKVWLMRSFGREQWQIGIDTSRWQLLLATDKFNSGSAKRASLSLAWQWAF